MKYEVFMYDLFAGEEISCGKGLGVKYCEFDLYISVYYPDGENITYIRCSMSDIIHVGDLGYAREISKQVYSSKDLTYMGVLKKAMEWLRFS
ncbi:hypothetical protein D3C71_1682560 [compost metagenome]